MLIYKYRKYIHVSLYQCITGMKGEVLKIGLYSGIKFSLKLIDRFAVSLSSEQNLVNFQSFKSESFGLT